MYLLQLGIKFTKVEKKALREIIFALLKKSVPVQSQGSEISPHCRMVSFNSNNWVIAVWSAEDANQTCMVYEWQELHVGGVCKGHWSELFIKGSFTLCDFLWLQLRFVFAYNRLHRSWWCCCSRVCEHFHCVLCNPFVAIWKIRNRNQKKKHTVWMSLKSIRQSDILSICPSQRWETPSLELNYHCPLLGTFFSCIFVGN